SMTAVPGVVSQRVSSRRVARMQVRPPAFAAEFPVLALITGRLTVRFFTERLAVLPRFLNGIDLFIVPLLLPVAAIFWLVRPSPVRSAGIVFCCGLFTAAWGVSWLGKSKDI